MKNEMILKEFQQIYDRLSYCRDRSEVFTDFINVYLYYLSVGMLNEDYNIIEKKYSQEELSDFRLLMDVVAKNSEEFNDSLGDVFMEYVSHGHNGQFFTPIHICDFMARISGGDELRSEDSVCDPCCGSGRMLLSAAKLTSKKNNGSRPYCYGSDIDLLCVKMCVINMIINSIPGEVAWMDALSMEHWRSYHIELILVCGMWFPSLKVTGAGQTTFIQRLKKTMETKPELIEQVKEKIEARQLSLDF